MNCLCPTVHDENSMSEMELAQRDDLQQQPLAFSSSDPSFSSSLVAATSRIVVPVQVLVQKHWRWIFLNVEVFEENTHEESMLVMYIPGICESAETKSVQQLAQWARSIGVKVAVLELQGHGLSSGNLADMTTDLDVLIGQVLLALKHTTAKLIEAKTPFVLSGSSLGGTLALYAAEYMSRRRQVELSGEDVTEKSNNVSSILYANDLWKDLFQCGRMAGVVSITPAVGVDPEALPPSWMVSTLGFFSSWAPTAQVPVTPLEESWHYNCPKSTKRNFAGNWPLVTSKFLLDMTSTIVPNDIETDQLTLRGIPRVVILAGAQDTMIPLASMKTLMDRLVATSKELVILPNAGHDVLLNPHSSAEALEHVFATLLHGKKSMQEAASEKE